MDPALQAAITMATVIGVVGALLGALIVFALVYMTLERMKGPLAVGLMIIMGILACLVSYGLGRMNQPEAKTVEIVKEKECQPAQPTYVPLPLWHEAPVIRPRVIKKPAPKRAPVPCNKCG